MATQTLSKGPVTGQVDFPLTLQTDSDATGDGAGIRIVSGDTVVGAITCTLDDVDTGQLKSTLNFQTNDEGGDGLVTRFCIDDSGLLLAASDGTQALPVYSFDSNPDTGMYIAGSALTFTIDGTNEVLINSLGVIANSGAGFGCLNETSSATNPTLVPDRTEQGSGIGGTGNDVSIIAVGVEVMNADVLGVSFPLGYQSTAQALTPNSDGGTASTVLNFTTSVDVGAVDTDADDWILLPSLSAVPVGHTITVMCNAGTAFEIRTPAASNELINTVDADGGSAELTAVDTEMIIIQKVSDTDGWIARSFTALGADNAALVPSA